MKHAMISDGTRIVREIDGLGSRQREILRVICARGGATVREIHARIPDPPDSVCGLRTQLNRLVKRGLLKSRRSGRHSEMLYLPAQSAADVQSCAFERLIIEHFDGSARHALHELMRLAAAEPSATSQVRGSAIPRDRFPKS